MHVCIDCGSRNLEEFHISSRWVLMWLLIFSTISIILYSNVPLSAVYLKASFWSFLLYFGPILLSFNAFAHLVERRGHFRATHSCKTCNSLKVLHINTNAGKEACIKHNVKIENEAA